MITPMTKLTMLIYHRDYKQFLIELREHGVVHVHAKKQTLQDEVMKAKMAEMKHVSNTIKLLEKDHKTTSQQDNKELDYRLLAVTLTFRWQPDSRLKEARFSEITITSGRKNWRNPTATESRR